MRLPVLALTLILAFVVPTVGAGSSYDQNRDLLSLHFDHAPDRDDGHAAAAAKQLVRVQGITPHVVGGSYGRWNADRYVPESERVMDVVWGGAWYNAHSNWTGATAATVSRWLGVLSAGGDIWIAEGGQSDFSADVVREIQRLRPALDTRARIHLVQHSDWNEVHADQSDLNFVRANTDYILIDDGNFDNGTADLNQRSQSFVDDALSGPFGTAWAAAFAYLDPNFKLDFSDTVEVLHIIGVGTNEVRTPDDFAARFRLNAGATDATPSFAMYWSDSYSVDGQCYCDSNFDPGLAAVSVSTPVGQRLVSQVCADIRNRFGQGRSSGRSYYNTVQCGHPPANNAADERDCPGFLTDRSGNVREYQCNATGATWNLAAVYPSASASVAPSAPDNLIQPICSTPAVDPDGDGFGWENNATCVVGANSTVSQSVQSAMPVGSQSHPVCVLANSDSDGDGFGWENNASCIVSGQATTAGSASSGGLPVCQQSGSDPDGDGFGWENQTSCVAASSDSGRLPAGNDSSGRPVCVNGSASDSDGDGFGWENNQTCIVR